MSLNRSSETGFTLVEMTVVLLLITLLASVAMRETAELGFQTRYEQTRERLDMIKQAILGNPKQIINGQQAVSGFVADMGRLPDNLRDLLQMGFCVTAGATNPPLPAQIVIAAKNPNACTGTNEWRWTNYPCTDGVSGFAACTGGHVWLAKQVDVTLNTGLNFGWNGSYLSVSGNPTDSDVLTDGWGRLAQGYCSRIDYTDQTSCVSNGYVWVTDTSDYNYGWYFDSLTYPNSQLIIQSYGKNHEYAGSDYYDADYPPIPVGQPPQPVVKNQDWLVDISGGIKTNIKLPSRDTRQIPPVSFCTDSTKTTKANCTSPGIWFGGCEDQTYYNKSSCTGGSKKWYSCSINTLDVDDANYSSCASPNCLKNKTDCETAGAVWYGEGFGCEDQTKITKTDCTIAGKTWRSCTDTGAITTHSACAGVKELWYGESFNGGCSDIHYTNKASCETATKTWHACSIVGETNFLSCEAAGGYWLGNGYGCSDQQYSSQAACEFNSKLWIESWPRCKKIALPNTELLVPYHNIKTNKDECEGVGGNWKYPRKQVCLNVFYRNNGILTVATSLPTLIEEDGAYQTMQFNGFYLPDFNDIDSDGNRYESLGNVLAVPTGSNAIGIYEYDGDCDPVNNPPYPADRQNPIQLDFQPHATLPVINW